MSRLFAMLLLGLCVAVAGSAAGLQPAAAEAKAKDQLKKANQGARARDHVFDGRKAPPPAVRAQPRAKPSPVGQPVTSTRTTPGYKPAPPRMHTINVPSPVTKKK